MTTLAPYPWIPIRVILEHIEASEICSYNRLVFEWLRYPVDRVRATLDWLLQQDLISLTSDCDPIITLTTAGEQWLVARRQEDENRRKTPQKHRGTKINAFPSEDMDKEHQLAYRKRERELQRRQRRYKAHIEAAKLQERERNQYEDKN